MHFINIETEKNCNVIYIVDTTFVSNLETHINTNNGKSLKYIAKNKF
jgi:hypothetical protein